MIEPELLARLLERDIPVKIVGKAEKLYYHGLRVDAKPGARVTLPLPLGEYLVSKKTAIIDEEALPKLIHLKKIRWKEINTEGLTRLPEDFYFKSSLLLKVLKEKTPGDREEEFKLRQVSLALTDILTMRTRKIVRAASLNPTPSREFMENMTPEERLFYLELCRLINEWYSSMTKFLEGGIDGK